MTRVAIIGGCRTPFVKAAGVFSKYNFLELGQHVIKAGVERWKLDPEKIDEFIFGTVLLSPRAPNFAREVIIGAGLPASICTHSVSNYCISGLVAVNMITEAIRSGRVRVGVAGGSESMSRPALTLTQKAEDFYLKLARTRTMGERLALFATFRPSFIPPEPPSPKEPSTGLTMGQHCEITTQEMKIARPAQDRIAYLSHKNAARAQSEGTLGAEIAPLNGVDRDNIIRADTTEEKLAKLKPVFERSEKGTLTAGNASPLTDGASVVCLMSEHEAKKQGREILGFIEDVEYAAIHPRDGLLMAPGLALPRLLQRRSLGIQDIDFFEIHEAFAAQVAANLQVWEQGWSKFPNMKPIGKIPEEKINVNGGSIAIGHPFAATGGRLVLSAANHLKKTGQKRAAISVCAAGGMACAMLISRE